MQKFFILMPQNGNLTYLATIKSNRLKNFEVTKDFILELHVFLRAKSSDPLKFSIGDKF